LVGRVSVRITVFTFCIDLMFDTLDTTVKMGIVEGVKLIDKFVLGTTRELVAIVVDNLASAAAGFEDRSP